MDLIAHIQQDQARRQALVDWRNNKEAIQLLAAAVEASKKADKIKEGA
ncbi:hypothetical protein [Loigolactobacillus rennini]|nr:hypothetical protein [Loigolactobacillus rennini]